MRQKSFKGLLNFGLYRATGCMLTRETPQQRQLAVQQAEEQARLRASGRASFSQFGEDISAANLLGRLSTGFYVDIGAHHPLKHSNTAFFHNRGWSGVNVEPMEDGIRAFERVRPHATNVRAAIHNELDQVTLYKFETGLTSTVIPDRAIMLGRNHATAGEEVVPALSLNDVFERYVPDGVHVNYLTVDIEGYDTEAILAFDTARYQPDVMCIEIHSLDILDLGAHPVVRHLINSGYFPDAFNSFSLTLANVEAAADPDRLGKERVLRSRRRSLRTGSLALD